MMFADKRDAEQWIIRNQLGRRNINSFIRAELALKLKPRIAEKAREKQSTHTEQGYQKSDKAEHTAKELGKIAGISHDTIHKVETIKNIRRMQFADREEAKIWIIKNQFGRRNLSAYDRSVLALKLKPMIAEKAKERQAQAGRGEEVQKSAQAKTRDTLAKVAGVSHDTIHKVEAIERNASPEVKQQLREGKIL